MPRRRGFIGRLVDSFKEAIGVGQPVEEPDNEPPPSEPPRGPPSGPVNYPPPDEGNSQEARFRETYHDIQGTYTGYLDWYDMFDRLAVDYEDEREREYFWDLYLRSFALRSDEPGAVRRGNADNPGRFYQESGLDPSAIDWREWREAMGYGSRK